MSKLIKATKRLPHPSPLPMGEGRVRAWSKGFTLIEIMIVLAVLAVLAAVVIPNVVGFLGRGKERSWNADQKAIAAAVDAYQSDPGNTKYRGVRQYPIWGRVATTNLVGVACADDLDANAGENYDRGTKGGSPVWVDDDGDGTRDAGEKWNKVTQTFGATIYCNSTGNFIIDLDELLTKNFLKEAPKSGSLDNKTAATGSYTWYVKADGTVDSLYYHLPAATSTGFQSGIYP